MLFPVYPKSEATSTLATGKPFPLWPVIILCLVTFYIYSPVARFDYLAIDDAIHTEGNPQISPLTWNNVLSFWTSPFENAYTPITYTAWAFLAHIGKNTPEEKELSKTRMNPEGNKYKPGVFHIGNALAHLLCTLTVFFILQLLVNSSLAATLGAVLFAAHPVQVETVCWITALRDVLAGLFSMLSLWLYFKSIKNPLRQRREYLFYGAGFVSFLIAILCKSSALMVPFIGALLAFLYFRKNIKSLIFDFLPWGLLTIPILKVFVGLNDSVALKVVHPTTLPQRLLIAGDAITFYLSKLIFPYELSMDYGRTPQSVLASSTTYFLALIPVLMGVICLYLYLAKKWRWPIAGFGIFVIGLGPILGITPFIFQHISTTADRYVYLSFLAPALLIAFFIENFKWDSMRIATTALLLVFTLKSASQVEVWRNNLTLFSHSLQTTPRSWLASNNLGTVYEGMGEFDTAMSLYERAAELSNIPSAWNNAGAMAIEANDFSRAVFFFEQAIETSSHSSWAYHNMGTTYWKKGDHKNAMKYYQLAANKNERFKDAHKNPIILRKDDGKTSASG